MSGKPATVKVYEVIYHLDDGHGGAFGDGSHIKRFRARHQAEDFAKGRTYYGRPAKVDEDDVPRKLAQRWGSRERPTELHVRGAV